MATDTYRLSQRPASHYLELFDAAEAKIFPGLRGLPASLDREVGHEDDELCFDVRLPIEFGQPRTDLTEVARSVVAHITEMDDAFRSSGHADSEDPLLAWVDVREFYVAFEYYSTTVNTQWAEHFTPTDNGGWCYRGESLPWMTHWNLKKQPAILAVDAAYGEMRSAAGGAYFTDWTSEHEVAACALTRDGAPPPYQPGSFYKRELPLLMAVIDQAPMPLSTIVVDGYVWLSRDGAPGLGARLHEALGRRVPVIGVAKTKFKDDTWSLPVVRGIGETPLFITSIGVNQKEAAANVARMSGLGRIPKLLSEADKRARSALSEVGRI